MNFIFQFPTELPNQLIALFAMMDKDEIKFLDAEFFLSFRTMWMPPTKAREFLMNAMASNLLVGNRQHLMLAPGLKKIRDEMEEKARKQAAELAQVRNIQVNAMAKQGFLDYFRILFVPDVIRKSYSTKLQNIEIRELKPEEKFAKIFVTESNNVAMSKVVFNGKLETLAHNCNDPTFLQNASEGKFCHHICSAFRKLEKENKDFAIDLIHQLALKWKAWKFALSETATKLTK